MTSISFRKIAVAVPWYSEHDAVSNDAYFQHLFFRSLGFTSILYAEGTSPHLQGRLTGFEEFMNMVRDPSALLIYHHGVYWAQGEAILREAKCTIHLKYHNITPPDFFRGYDRNSTYATELGRAQTQRILEMNKVSLFVGDSQYNIDDLLSYGLRIRSAIVAPFTQIQDFDEVEADPDIKQEMKAGGKKNVLFVGRVVPNKGHVHLFRTLNRFIDFYGTNICLHLVGGFALAENTYFIELENIINQSKLGPFIKFHQKINSAKLKAFYQYSDAFLLMSEHEGFCVPILEAQYLDLPIVALNRTAVGETLGPQQIIYPETDYDFFASALQRVFTHTELRKSVIENGRLNYLRFRPEALQQQTLALLQQPL